ncbi:MAG: cache domain-containing protein [Campylobacterota bacterium]|nr:cache domain-containing protein [Campylobacterota bacterium]
MNSSVNKNQVILTILLIFSISYSIHTYIMYKEKKDDIHYISSDIKQKLDNLYDEISLSMLQTQLKQRTKFMLEKQKKLEKLQAFKDKDQQQLQKLFKIHYETLKEQIGGFNIMHFYDRDGISILRMHNTAKSGDDLKEFRSCVDSVVKNPRSCSFFEVGLQGLAYRNITPVYLKNELIGFFEIGVKPTMLISKIKKVFGLNAYFFINDKFVPKNMDRNINTLKTDKYTLCQFCSKKDQFITDNIEKINLNNTENKNIEYNDKTYSLVSKKIYDAQSNNIGELVFFQDITLLQHQLIKLLINSLIIYILSVVIIYFILTKYISTIFNILTRARYLLDNTNDAVYVVRLKDASIVDVNDRASLMMGFTRNELLSKTVFDIRESIPGSKQLNWEEHVRELKLNHFLTS